MAKRVTVEELNRKLNKILKNQKLILEEEAEELKEEKKIESEEEEELRKLKAIHAEITEELGAHPLTKITIRDIAKGAIGSFIGVVAHFTFFYGIEVAEWLSMARATALFPISFAIGGIFMYATGFRKIKDKKILSFLPVRLVVLYLVSLIVSMLVLAFFSPEFSHGFEIAYKQLSTVTLIAVVGACTADLIGKE